MPIGGAISAIGSIGSALIGGSAAKKASQQQLAMQQQALGLQRQMFEQSQANFKPFIDTGQGAVLSLAQLYGLNTPGNPGGGVPFGPEALDAFRRSPDYEFARAEGMRALTNANSATGLLGRSHLDTMAKFTTGLATQNFDRYAGRLYSLADLGNRAATSAGQGMTMQGQVLGNTLMGMGQTQAAGTLGQGAAYQTAWGGIVNALGQYNAQNRNASSYLPGFSGGYGSSALSIPKGYLPVGSTGFGGWVNPDYASVGGGYGVGGVY